MASTKEYRDFILEQLNLLNNITCKPMMGEYLLYYDGLLFGGVYDDRFLLKATPSIKETLKDTPLDVPYSNGSLMYLVDVEDRALLKKVIPLIHDDLKTKKTKRL